MSSEAPDWSNESGGEHEGPPETAEHLVERMAESAATGPTGATKLPKYLSDYEGLGPWVLHRFTEAQTPGVDNDQALDAVVKRYEVLERAHLVKLGRRVTALLVMAKYDIRQEPLRTWLEVFGNPKYGVVEADDEPLPPVVFEPTPDGPYQKLSRAAEILKTSPAGKPLNDTETRVLELMALGERDKTVIARRMGEIPPTTVKAAMSSLYSKYGLKDAHPLEKADMAANKALAVLREKLQSEESEVAESSNEPDVAETQHSDDNRPLPPFAIDILTEQQELPLDPRVAEFLILDLAGLDIKQIAEEMEETMPIVRGLAMRANMALGLKNVANKKKADVRRQKTRAIIFRNAP